LCMGKETLHAAQYAEPVTALGPISTQAHVLAIFMFYSRG
jgi:hypothetical protein